MLKPSADTRILNPSGGDLRPLCCLFRSMRNHFALILFVACEKHHNNRPGRVEYIPTEDLYVPMVDSAQVISILERWRPKKFQNEQKYKDDLSTYLDRELNNHNANTTKSTIPVNRVQGNGLCDIVIDRDIGVEVRKDLATQKQIKTFCTELNSYKRGYAEVIIVLLGNSSPNALELLKTDVHIRSTVYESPAPIT